MIDLLQRSRHFKKMCASTAFMTIVSLFAPGLLGLNLLVPSAHAATVNINMSGLMNGGFPGAPVPLNSNAMAIAKLGVAAATSGQLTSVQVNFSGVGFATSDLAGIATASSSGVALYQDNGSVAGSFDPTDQVVRLAGTPDWSSGTSSIILTPASTSTVSLTSTETVLYLAIRTSGSASNGDQIIASVPVNGIVTSSDGNGPTTAFNSNFVQVDTAAPTIASCEGFVGSPTVTVRFSEPVQRISSGLPAGALNTSSITYTPNGTSQTISAISHEFGRNFATLTLSANLASDNLDGSPATCAMAASSVADMGLNVGGTSAVGVSSPLGITTNSIPATSVGAVFNTSAPLVTFAASGGSGGYFFAPADAAATSTLTSLGLALEASTGKITGTVASVTGSFSLGIRVTDSLAGTSVRVYTINVAGTSGGSFPGIVSVTPSGGPQSTASMTLSIVGSNTSFSSASQIRFILPVGVVGTNGVATTTNVVTATATDATHVSFPIAISAGATAGGRDIEIRTGAQVITMPNAFFVFASGGSGGALTQLLPVSGATGLGTTPTFSFSPGSDPSVLAFRLKVYAGSSADSAVLWDYASPSSTSESTSHCNATQCNIPYGTLRFRAVSPPQPLLANTTYYWQVLAYATAVASVTDAGVLPRSSSPLRSFTTISSVTDTSPPSIFHFNVSRATESATLNLFARIVDNVVTTATTPGLTTKILHCQGNGCVPNVQVNGVWMGADYFRFPIPASGSGIGAAGVYTRYSILASDGTATSTFPMGGVTTTAVTAGSGTISGTVTDSSGACTAAVQGATVFAEGTGLSATTDGSCAFTLSNVFAGSFPVVAFKSGLCEVRAEGITPGTTGLALRFGSCSFSGGFGGDTVRPRVRFTTPMDQGQAPGNEFNFKACIIFTKTMNESAMTSANLTVKEINPSTGATTDITATRGAWTYYATPPSPSIMGVMNESNQACYSLSSAWGDNKTIAIGVSRNVTDSSGNPIQGNQSSGDYVFTFTTRGSFSGTFTGGTSFGSGAFTPNRVSGSSPFPGEFGVPTNRAATINFQETMAADGGAYALRNCVKLFLASDTAETNLVTATALDSNSKIATLTTSALSGNTRYKIKVLGCAKSSNGLTLGPPDSTGAAQVMYLAEFTTSAGADTTPISVIGASPSNNATNVLTNFGLINLAFNTTPDCSTINSSSFNLTVGSSALNATIDCRPMERRVTLRPNSALSPSTTYTINLTTDVRGTNGIALATAIAYTFQTSATPDTTAPSVLYVNADTANIVVTFSEPMMADNALSSSFARSVVNPLAYNTITCGGSAVNLSTARFTSAENNSVMIQNFTGCTAGQTLVVTMDTSGDNQTRDLAGNALASGGETASVVVRDSATTGGFVGVGSRPSSGSGGGTSGDFGMGGGFVGGNFSSASMGFMPQPEVRPMTMVAGLRSKYMVRVPLSAAMASGTKIVLTYPSGFDVSAAIKDAASPMNRDWSMSTAGTQTFGNAPTGQDGSSDANRCGAANDGITCVGNVVTIYLSGATAANDFISFDLDGIVNTSVPLGFGTTGYTVDVKIMSGTTIQETMTSMPFFIQQSSGSNTVNVQLYMVGNVGTCDVTVHAFQPGVGPRSATASFTGAAYATATFANVGNGELMIGTDRTITCGANQYAGRQMPERRFISGNTDVTLALPSLSSGGTVVSFVVTGGSGKSIDYFCGSNMGGDFRVGQIVLSSSPQTVTLRVADGTYFCGVGPQMRSGFDSSGPPPAPDYVMPRPKDLRVASSICTVDGTPGSCSMAFTLASASKTIKGIVKNQSGLPMANVGVFASQQNGPGTGGMTGADGVFTMNVGEGTYSVGANFNGAQSRVATVRVSDHATSYLFIDGASTGITPAAAASSFILSTALPSCTISGNVTDASGNAVQNAGMGARLTTGPGFANSMTNSSGAYTLYVNCTGSYEVTVYSPSIGGRLSQTVAMTGSSQSGINFSPSALVGSLCTTSGRVYKDLNSNTTYDAGEELSGAFVRMRNATNTTEGPTDSSGNYTLSAACGINYKVRAFVPGVGETPETAAFSMVANVTGKDVIIASPRVVTFIFSTTIVDGFVELIASSGFGNRADIRNATTVTVTVPDGSFEAKVRLLGVAISRTDIAATTGATVYDSGTGVVTVNGAESLTVTVPTLNTITATVTDGTANIADAWVEVSQSSSAIMTGCRTSSAGTCTIQVANGTYNLNAMKPGYIRSPTSLVVSGSSAQTLTMTQGTLSISGQVLVGSSGVANAFVRCERQGDGNFFGQTDASGNFSITVPANTVCSLKANVQGYAEASHASNPVTVGSSSVTGKNITASTVVTLDPPSSQTVSASSGGTIVDPTAGVSLTIPANAMTSDGSTLVVNMEQSNGLPTTDAQRPLTGFEFSAQTSDGTSVTTFNDEITGEIEFTPAELDDFNSSGGTPIDTLVEAATVQIGSFNSETGAYEMEATTMTCEDSSGNAVLNPASISACTTVSYEFPISHFSLYAPLVATDGAPSTPTGFTANSDGTTIINLSWTAVSGATSYDIYRSSSAAGTFSRLGSEPTVSSGATVSYSDTGLTAGTTYFYKITALNATGESASTGALTGTTGGSAASTGSGGGGGGASSSPSTTQPSSTTNTTNTTTSTAPLATRAPVSSGPAVSPPAATPVALPAAPAPVPLASVSVVTPVLATRLLSIPSAVVGANLRFSYEYANRTNKTQMVTIERLMLDAKGKIVKRSTANVKVLAGKIWKVDVNDKPTAAWKAGEYKLVIVIKDKQSKKVLGQIQDKVTITAKGSPVKPPSTPKPVQPAAPAAAPAPAPTPAPTPVPVPTGPVQAGVSFSGLADGAVLTRGGSLAFAYSYGNPLKKDQAINVTRELVDGNGKTVQISRGSATVKAGMAWNASVKEAIQSTIVPGSYSVIVTVTDKKTGEVLSESAVFVTVK